MDKPALSWGIFTYINPSQHELLTTDFNIKKKNS